MKRAFLTGMAAAVLGACQWQQMPAWESVPGNNCNLTHYRLGVPQGHTKTVNLRESEQEAIRLYLQDFTQTGKPTLITYAPGTVFQGDAFTVNFKPEEVVLNIGKHEQAQYVRPRTQKDNEILLILRKRSDSRQLKAPTL